MADTNYSARPSNSSVPGSWLESYNCVLLPSYLPMLCGRAALSPFLLVLSQPHHCTVAPLHRSMFVSPVCLPRDQDLATWAARHRQDAGWWPHTALYLGPTCHPAQCVVVRGEREEQTCLLQPTVQSFNPKFECMPLNLV